MLRARLTVIFEKHENKCQKNAENGSISRSNPKTQNNRSVFKKTYSDSDNKSDSDIESVSDSDNDNESGRSFDLEDFFESAVKRSYGE